MLLNQRWEGDELQVQGEIELFVCISFLEAPRRRAALVVARKGRTEEIKRPKEMDCCARVIVAVGCDIKEGRSVGDALDAQVPRLLLYFCL